MEKEVPTLLFEKSKWIWAKDPCKKDSYIVLTRKFSFGQDRPPAHAICRAACDTHYCLLVNGNAAVWMGGLGRSTHTGYYDEFDIGKYLIKGDNTIEVRCHYFGSDGRDLVCTERAGFIFECHTLGIYSDKSFRVHTYLGYKTARSTNCCYAGRSINYDATLENQVEEDATELDGYPDSAMGVLVERPLPMEKFSPQPVIVKPKKISNQFDGDTYIVPLPREMTVTPFLDVVAGDSGERITIKTDRTDCMGCFGDESSVYEAHSVVFTTQPTVNEFEPMLPMTGTALIFTMPSKVKVQRLGYREVSYNTAPTCEFQSTDGQLQTLFAKAQNTLYCCMGSTIMDNPERDRSMWLGDASVASRALYLAYADAAPLVKKVLEDVLRYEKGKPLYSCVPGNVPVDIPSHGLLALGEYGIIAQYINFTGDAELVKPEYTRLCDYLMMWGMTDRGVELRDGARRWYDNLYNIDERLIENALYYMACKATKGLGERFGDHDYDEEFEDRMGNIADYIESTWDGLGYTTIGDGYDDRANALIVLTGLVPAERKDAMARLIAATYGASPYMEWAVLEALDRLGRRDLARKRFDCRYTLAASDDKTTLGEDFNGFGTECQSYQSAVIAEVIQLFGGIDIKEGAKRITITPDFSALHDFRVKLKLNSGELEVRYKYSPTRIDIAVENRTEAKVELVMKPENFKGFTVAQRTAVLNKGKNKFTI